VRKPAASALEHLTPFKNLGVAIALQGVTRLLFPAIHHKPPSIHESHRGCDPFLKVGQVVPNVLGLFAHDDEAVSWVSFWKKTDAACLQRSAHAARNARERQAAGKRAWGMDELAGMSM
jgi:hypothetical protein